MAKPSQKKKAVKKVVARVEKAVVKQPRPRLAVPRHNVVMLRPSVADSHRDATNDSLTCYLQPFVAYEARLMGGLPIAAQAQSAYGFWTRNVQVVTDIPFTGTSNVGTYLAIRPWLNGQIGITTAFDSLGLPTSQTSAQDPFYAAINVNFESVVVAYQGVRVKNMTKVLSQGGEALIGRIPVSDELKSYYIHRSSGTSFVKSAADPGVLLTLSYEGQGGMTPVVAGNIIDYGWNLPSNGNLDPQSTEMIFRSQSASDSPQTWELEVVTYYLARPYASTSVFFAPSKHEVDMRKFDRAVDRSFGHAPEFSIERCALKDDGFADITASDLQSIWGGAKSFVKVATSAWSGLRSLFGLSAERKRLVHLALCQDDCDLDELRVGIRTGTLSELKDECEEKMAPPPFTEAQLECIRVALSRTNPLTRR